MDAQAAGVEAGDAVIFADKRWVGWYGAGSPALEREGEKQRQRVEQGLYGGICCWSWTYGRRNTGRPCWKD